MSWASRKNALRVQTSACKKQDDAAMGLACRLFHAKPEFLGQHQDRATQPRMRLASYVF